MSHFQFKRYWIICEVKTQTLMKLSTMKSILITTIQSVSIKILNSHGQTATRGPYVAPDPYAAPMLSKSPIEDTNLYIYIYIYIRSFLRKRKNFSLFLRQMITRIVFRIKYGSSLLQRKITLNLFCSAACLMMIYVSRNPLLEKGCPSMI